MRPFTHLHVHSQYSILDGAASIPALVKKAKADGMTALALTDHGNMYGSKHFFDTCTANGIKPIIGCEVYVARRRLQDKVDKEDRAGDHLILLAKNKTGYHNLTRMITISAIEGHYYKPRIDKELLKKYHEGIIASSACLGGEVPQALLKGNEKEAEEDALWFKDLFGEDYYLEMQRHETGDPQKDADVYIRQVEVNKKLVEFAGKHDIKLIATNDVHFVNAEDAEAHDRLICLNTGKDLDDPNRMRYTMQEYFKTGEEMKEIFSDIPEAIENTALIADKVENYDINSAPIMPDFPLPEGFDNEDAYLKHLTYKGAKMRYGEITEGTRERIDFELSVIEKMGYPGYFLIVWDLIAAGREMGVSVGPGRGSAAGSVVAYCLRITEIDPIEYGLLFERFLNPDRISLPDIDIDFDEDGRDDVLKWVVNKYGESRVAHIITFGSMAVKMAIRDVARVEKLPLQEADRLAKLVPEKPGVSFADAFKESKELKEAKESKDPLVSRTLKYAEILEGSVRHTGIHACGVIIGRDDLIEHIPLTTAKDADLLVTQYDGRFIEAVGMLKMDFLGLKTLSIIRDAVENVKDSTGKELDIDTIPLDDEETYKLYARGDTIGLFQFESEGMRKHLKALQPNRFEDLIAMNALYRPGPMEYIPEFIKRKHGRAKISYEAPVMEEYLEETYGITVYQEQVMQLSRAMAGFTRGEADKLRKAMGKKQKTVMDELKEKFLEGCKGNDIDEKIANKVWHDWEEFAKYAFNKSHSTCYANVSYREAYLKCHYPSEYMAALLSRNIKDLKKLTIFMDECGRMGISVFGPDINESRLKFTVVKDGNIRFGMEAIKGMGANASKEIIAEREESGAFKDIYDLVERIDLSAVNKKSLEACAMAGAFDCFTDIKREQYFAPDDNGVTFIESLIKYGNRVSHESNNSQQSLFGESIAQEFTKPVPPLAEEWPKLVRLNKEKELVGIYMSAHPLDDYKFEIGALTNTKLADIGELKDIAGRDLVMAGLVSDVRTGTSKNGKPYGFFTLQDKGGSFRIPLFNSEYLTYAKYFVKDLAVLVKGKSQAHPYREGEFEFKVKSMYLLNEVREELIKSITINISIDAIDPVLIEGIQKVSMTKGKVLFKFNIFDAENNISVGLFSRNKSIELTDDFISYFDRTPGMELSLK